MPSSRQRSRGGAWKRGRDIPPHVRQYAEASDRLLITNPAAVEFLRAKAGGKRDITITDTLLDPPRASLSDTPEGKNLLKGLDAYGHLTWTVGFGEEGDRRGDWMAAADFAVGKIGNRKVVAYHVVVNSESGGFIDTLEARVVPLREAPFGLLDRWRDIGAGQFSRIKRSEDRENEKASKAFDAALLRAVGGRLPR